MGISRTVNGMPLTVLETQKVHFLSLTAAEGDAQAKGWGWAAFRAQQVREWVYSRLVTDAAAMTSLPKADRELLAAKVEFTPANVVAHQASSDGTQKLLLSWPDGANA